MYEMGVPRDCVVVLYLRCGVEFRVVGGGGGGVVCCVLCGGWCMVCVWWENGSGL